MADFSQVSDRKHGHTGDCHLTHTNTCIYFHGANELTTWPSGGQTDNGGRTVQTTEDGRIFCNLHSNINQSNPLLRPLGGGHGDLNS